MMRVIANSLTHCKLRYEIAQASAGTRPSDAILRIRR
jgi:hypothetical protein